MKPLNTQQKAAVTASESNVLVIAGAGTGKTRILAHRAAWLIENGAMPEEILLLTFSTKAASLMLERVRDITGIPAGCLMGGTFHQVGRMILRQAALHAGLSPAFRIMDASGARLLFEEVHSGMLRQTELAEALPPAQRLFEIWNLSRVTRTPFMLLLNEYVDLEESPFTHESQCAIEGVISEYEMSKVRGDLADYDDLLVKPVQLLQAHPEIRQIWQERFRHVLVDEYQDTNPLQEELIDILSERGKICAVGDDAQAIYSWRGADVTGIREFSLRNSGTRLYPVETNYRSNPEILRLANAIPLARISEIILRPHRSEGKPVEWIRPADFPGQADTMVSRITEMKKAGRCLNGIAILCRAHFLSLDLQLALAEAGLPVQLATGAEPFFYQPHIRVAIDCLRLQNDPEHAEALDSINRLLPETGTDAGKEHWQQVREALLELRAAPMSGAIRLLREGWVGKTLSRQYPEASRIMEDLEILAAFLGAFADREGFFTKMKRMGSPSRRRGHRCCGWLTTST